jgi:hypothetical protein
MPEWIWHFLYGFCGGFVGFFVASLCSMARDSDAAIDRIMRGRR